MTTTATGWARPILTSLHGRLIGLASASGGAAGLIVKAAPDGVTYSAASGAANTCNLTIQVVDNEGFALSVVTTFLLWVSDAATGAGLSSHANTSELTCSTGQLMAILTTEKAWLVQSDATGKVVAVITDTSKTAYYPAVQIGMHSAPRVAAVLATANYG